MKNEMLNKLADAIEIAEENYWRAYEEYGACDDWTNETHAMLRGLKEAWIVMTGESYETAWTRESMDKDGVIHYKGYEIVKTPEVVNADWCMEYIYVISKDGVRVGDAYDKHEVRYLINTGKLHIL